MKKVITQIVVMLSVALFLTPITSVKAQETNDSIATPEQPSKVQRMGTVSFNTHYLYAFYGINAAYEWPVLPETTLVLEASGGYALIYSMFYSAFSARGGVFYTREQVNLRWRFDTNYRLRKGYSLRYNSGFYGEASLAYTMLIARIKTENNGNTCGQSGCSGESVSQTDTGIAHLPTLSLNVGYRYTFKNRIYFEAKTGIGVGVLLGQGEVTTIPFSPIDIKIGYAF